MDFSCQVDQDGLRLKIGPHQGAYPAWWKEIHAQIYGWTPKERVVLINSTKVTPGVNREGDGADFLFPDDGKGIEVEIH
jgi:alpha-glucosidase